MSCNRGIACIIRNNKIQIICDYIVNMQKYKGYLDVREVFIIALLVAIIFTLYVYFYAKHEVIKKQESELSNSNLLILYANRFIHYFSTFFIWFYVYFAKVVFFNDFVFGILFCLQLLHWTILKECILSIMEKNILEPGYVAGSNSTYEPFMRLIGINRAIIFGLVAGTFIFATLRLTVWRK